MTLRQDAQTPVPQKGCARHLWNRRSAGFEANRQDGTWFYHGYADRATRFGPRFHNIKRETQHFS